MDFGRADVLFWEPADVEAEAGERDDVGDAHGSELGLKSKQTLSTICQQHIYSITYRDDGITHPAPEEDPVGEWDECVHPHGDEEAELDHGRPGAGAEARGEAEEGDGGEEEDHHREVEGAPTL